MPRPRSCDIDKAINKAINAATALFWKNGYTLGIEHASIVQFVGQ